mmetsp:Transcript_37528/g.71915  ORF Transcript_37528/g.71915 Transcript_37528/m.71915 type:complete len:296 (-) Transcript_37528:1877-2764(-)
MLLYQLVQAQALALAAPEGANRYQGLGADVRGDLGRVPAVQAHRVHVQLLLLLGPRPLIHHPGRARIRLLCARRLPKAQHGFGEVLGLGGEHLRHLILGSFLGRRGVLPPVAGVWGGARALASWPHRPLPAALARARPKPLLLRRPKGHSCGSCGFRLFGSFAGLVGGGGGGHARASSPWGGQREHSWRCWGDSVLRLPMRCRLVQNLRAHHPCLVLAPDRLLPRLRGARARVGEPACVGVGVCGGEVAVRPATAVVHRGALRLNVLPTLLELGFAAKSAVVFLALVVVHHAVRH